MCLRPGLILWYNLSYGKRTSDLVHRSLYRSGSLTTVARELAQYQLNFIGKQDLRQDKRGTVRAREYIFFYGKGHKNDQYGKGILHTTK